MQMIEFDMVAPMGMNITLGNFDFMKEKNLFLSFFPFSLSLARSLTKEKLLQEKIEEMNQI